MEFSNPNPMDGIPALRFQQAPVKAIGLHSKVRVLSELQGYPPG